MLPALPTSQLHNHSCLVDTKGANQSSSTSSSRQTPSPTQSVNKRPASMIFRIEHLLPTATTPPGTVGTHHSSPEAVSSRHQRSSSPKRTKVVRGGVHCSQFIPKDTMSECIDTQSLIGSLVSTSETLARAFCSLSHEGGRLNITPSILRKIKLSEDLQSYNALFELKKGEVTLRVTRDIQRDEEIVAWFGEEVTLLMSIPFLTPLNIQGNNRYTCHLCHLTFETPNPLKIHLALGCGRHNIDVLWMRLHYAIKATHYRQQLLPLPLLASTSSTVTARLSPLQPTSSTTSASLSPSHSPQPQQAPQPSQRFSAFKPISAPMPPHHHQHATASIPLPVSLTQALHMSSHHHTSTAPLSFLPSMSTAALPHMSLLQPPSTNPLNAAAQIEAIVSNMGASKQGHLCIYCGKVYSRKYGLKIHIRTHTGFKPLKCKFCLRPFGDPSNLNKHVRLHLQSSAGGSSTGEGYQCTLCHKTLARRRDLQKHMETRHDGSTTINVESTETNSSD